MLKRIKSLFVRPDEEGAAVELTPADHRALDETAWQVVDALRAAAADLRCEVRAAVDHREVAFVSPNPDLPAVMIVVDRAELRLVYGNDIQWARALGADPDAVIRGVVAAVVPLLEGREFLSLRRLDGHVVETGVGSLESGVTGLWPEAMTRDRLGPGELTTELQAWRGPLSADEAARLRSRPRSESQARLERNTEDEGPGA